MPIKDKEKCNAYRRKWYADNKERFNGLNGYNRTQRAKRRDLVRNIKGRIACEECGENRVPALDFHHIDPTTKIGTINYLSNYGTGIKKLIEEIRKCRVLCSNCHRVEHAKHRSTKTD